jgi:hypothetical protein
MDIKERANAEHQHPRRISLPKAGRMPYRKEEQKTSSESVQRGCFHSAGSLCDASGHSLSRRECSRADRLASWISIENKSTHMMDGMKAARRYLGASTERLSS